MSAAVQQWVDRDQYDIDASKAMLDSGRYLCVLFCCQQAIEKMPKPEPATSAGYVMKQGRPIPFESQAR